MCFIILIFQYSGILQETIRFIKKTSSLCKTAVCSKLNQKLNTYKIDMSNLS